MIIKNLKKNHEDISDKQLVYQVLRNSMSIMINDIYNTTKINLSNDFNKIWKWSIDNPQFFWKHLIHRMSHK